jgi:hypothetical protein
MQDPLLLTQLIRNFSDVFCPPSRQDHLHTEVFIEMHMGGDEDGGMMVML